MARVITVQSGRIRKTNKYILDFSSYGELSSGVRILLGGGSVPPDTILLGGVTQLSGRAHQGFRAADSYLRFFVFFIRRRHSAGKVSRE